MLLLRLLKQLENLYFTNRLQDFPKKVLSRTREYVHLDYLKSKWKALTGSMDLNGLRGGFHKDEGSELLLEISLFFRGVSRIPPGRMYTHTILKINFLKIVCMYIRNPLPPPYPLSLPLPLLSYPVIQPRRPFS